MRSSTRLFAAGDATGDAAGDATGDAAGDAAGDASEGFSSPPIINIAADEDEHTTIRTTTPIMAAWDIFILYPKIKTLHRSQSHLCHRQASHNHQPSSQRS